MIKKKKGKPVNREDSVTSKVRPCSFPSCSFTSLFQLVMRAGAEGSHWLSLSHIALAGPVLCILLWGSHPVSFAPWQAHVRAGGTPGGGPATGWARRMTHGSWVSTLLAGSKASSDAAGAPQGDMSLPEAALCPLVGGRGGDVNHSRVSTR